MQVNVSLSNDIESYRIKAIEYLSIIFDSYRIIL